MELSKLQRLIDSGLTQKEIANILNISQSTVSKILHSGKISQKVDALIDIELEKIDIEDGSKLKADYDRLVIKVLVLLATITAFWYLIYILHNF